MYLDPGFGSMIIQGIIALIAGAGAYLIIIRKKIAALIRNRRSEKAQESETEDAQQG
jgi:hypothetical protein